MQHQLLKISSHKPEIGLSIGKTILVTTEALTLALYPSSNSQRGNGQAAEKEGLWVRPTKALQAVSLDDEERCLRWHLMA